MTVPKKRKHQLNKGIMKPVNKLVIQNKEELAARIAKYHNDPQLIDNKAYLAVLNGLIDVFVERTEMEDFADPKTLESIGRVVDVATKIIERDHKQRVGFYVSIEKLQMYGKVIIDKIRQGFREPVPGCDCSICEHSRDCPRQTLIADLIGSTPVPKSDIKAK